MNAANARVASVLETIADLLEVEDREAQKAGAYRRAAQSVRRHAQDVTELADAGRLRELHGVGPALAAKITEILATGSCAYLERLRSGLPPRILELLSVPGLGPRTAGLLYHRLGVGDLDRLEQVLASGEAENLPGLGPRRARALAAGLAAVRRHETDRRPLGEVLPGAERLCALISGWEGVEEAVVCGSIRRFRETVGDIDLVAAAADPPAVVAAFTALPGVRRVTSSGDTRASVVMDWLGQVDLWVVPPEQLPAAVHHATGSPAHHVRLRGLARQRGLNISEYGVARADGAALEVSAEADIYRCLDLPYIPPELREDSGELEAAARGELPELVEAGDLRGDLHVHSRWSDGTASLEELLQAAEARGYEYLAVTDHSQALAMARGLDAARLAEQCRSIATLNAGGGRARLLTGVEVDILRDGRLDLDDEVLAGLDVVVASAHLGLRSDGMTERLEGAIKNPHVDIIGHPTGRLLSGRGGASVDLERLLGLAARTGTALEINASPDRLDLGAEWARRARECGVRLAISSDAHSLAGLDDLRYGVGTARRGWLEPKDVLNTDSLPELLARRA